VAALSSVPAVPKAASVSPFNFPPGARLHNAADYAPAFDRRRSRRLAQGRWLVLLWVEPAASSAPSLAIPTRLGTMIGRRLVRHAIQRNTIKRVCREAFRLRRLQLLPGDYVVRVVARLPDDLTLTVLKRELRTEIEALLAKAMPAVRSRS
jgi:ribonuclease P protein component